MKNKNRCIALVMATALLVTSVAIPSNSVYAAENKNNDNNETKILSETNNKEEVVYIMTDANGNVSSVNVVNIFGAGDVTDYGEYSLVKMMTSNQPISQSGDVITFSTAEERVYYQGTLENAQIPWNISINYYLDGNKLSPEELAGQSGKLEIKISITENNKCNNAFFNDYALQTTFTLDAKNCENIVAQGATTANVGNDKQISYTILPGKGLEASITADVTDFEMDAVTINGIKLNLNIEIDDAELMEKVSEIMDATKKLNDGAEKLNDGTSDLFAGGSDLLGGMNSLYAGTESLNNGVITLSSGISQMQEGLNTLNSKSSALTGGSAKIKEALETIQKNLGEVSVSTEQLKTLTDSSSAIKQGISDLYDGAITLQNNISFAAYENAMSANGLDIEQLKAGNSSAIDSLTTQIAELQSSIQTIKSVPGYEANSEYVAQLTALEAQVTSLSNIVTLLSANNAAIGGTESYLTALGTGANELVQGLANLKTNYDTFDAAIIELANTLSGLAVNMSSLKSGIDQLVASYQTLDAGIGEYTDGVATIVVNYIKLVEGVNQLSEGSKNLLTGTATLKDGTVKMCEGITSLGDGTNEMLNGTTEFYNKTSDMDVQVQNQIDEMIASISGDETETVSFVSDKNTNVESVQFVIKTDSIKKATVEVPKDNEVQKKTFWQKLIALFGF